MILYKVSEKGDLNTLNQLDFSVDDIYLIDNDKTIYIWIGQNAVLNKKDLSVNIARNMNKKRGGSAKLLLFDQHREYGSFLAMMDSLKKGINPDTNIEKRAEFKFEDSKQIKKLEKMNSRNSEPDLMKWLKQLKQYRRTNDDYNTIKETNDDILKEMISVAAYFLSLNQLTYDELCWMLSEKQLIIKHGENNVSENMIKETAEQIFKSSSTYDELCWLIAELDIFIQEGYLKIGEI